MEIWRLQTNTQAGDISDYCIKNKVAAVGWSLLRCQNRDELNNLSFDAYCKQAKSHEYNRRSFANVIRLAQKVKPDDLIWMRRKGIYYLARITNKSTWRFNNSKDAEAHDACNQLSNVEWIRIGDESEIPGALSTSFIRGSTLQRIYKPGVSEYSALIYDWKSNDDYKYNPTFVLNEATFYSMISPIDCEDLLYFYSYKESKGKYVCIPSTNKLSTEKYEFVALDTATGKHVYYQVKNGNVPLNTDDYYDLTKASYDIVYLLTTRGRVMNEKKYKAIHVVNPTVLFEFACQKENANLIPPHIKYWMEFAGNQQQEKES